jgi:DNA-binding response OmpR family regulator
MQHLLIIEDDARLAQMVGEYLERSGFRITHAIDAKAGLALLQEPGAEPAPELVILDLMLPDMDGLEVCRRIRALPGERGQIPVLMLTAKGDPMDRIVGLELGADDYVPKPFDPRELVARVKSVLRRTSSAGRAELGAARVRIGRCILDLAAHRLIDERGVDVPMSPLEFDLLKALAEHPNRPLSRERILNLGKQRDWDPFDRSVDLRVMRLRKKVEPDPEHPRFIRTIRNEGYIFVPGGG